MREYVLVVESKQEDRHSLTVNAKDRWDACLEVFRSYQDDGQTDVQIRFIQEVI